MTMETDFLEQARNFMAGKRMTLAEIKAICKSCVAVNDVSTAREVLEFARQDRRSVEDLSDATKEAQDWIYIREAIYTSKDPELLASYKHDEALRLLAERFGRLSQDSLTDPEVLGVAGGICKRRWQDLGQTADLKRAAAFYERGAAGGLGDDGYCQINAAFLEDVLAGIGEDRDRRLAHARRLREHIVESLKPNAEVGDDMRWWNAATRAEALFGLGRYEEAKACIAAVDGLAPRDPWELETTIRQLVQLAKLRFEEPLAQKAIVDFFDVLVPGGAEQTRDAVMGRVGLALSGGGFRASFYHLGVLARLAELDVLRHVSVLSCVSGGSIVGVCYWMLLRRLLQQKKRPEQNDYQALVAELIEHFSCAVDKNLRARIQPTKAGVAWAVFRQRRKGALDPELAADALNELFYQPLAVKLGSHDRPYMHDLAFNPAGHPVGDGALPFRPGVDNWLRHDKVPALVVNATTVNTGHGWQFTPKWMGESPWTVHEAADAVPRLDWAAYDPASGWHVSVARAVAASAGVPLIFAPLDLGSLHEEGEFPVQLIDGGVHDNQGTVALIASNCSVVIVSDGCGQLMFDDAKGTGLLDVVAYGKRVMDMLMERVRLANFADLKSRRQVGLLQALMFVHMKAGLDANVKRPRHLQKSYSVRQAAVSASGIRQDFQRALAELRTDLDDFDEDERMALMACGYQMAAVSARNDLAQVSGLMCEAPHSPQGWCFGTMHAEITSTLGTTPRRKELLKKFASGSKVDLSP